MALVKRGVFIMNILVIGCGKLGAVRALTNPIYFQKEEEEDN